jgi:hypothetical protein
MKLLALFLALFSSSLALAQDAPPAPAAPPAPSPAEASKVLDYYYKGKGAGPLLLDSKACLQVDNKKDSPTKSDCIDTVSGKVKKNALVSLWTMWLVPEGDKYEDVAVQFLYQGQVRTTKDVALQGSMRYRTYSSSTLNKSGKWTIKAVRGTTELASVDVDVE